MEREMQSTRLAASLTTYLESSRTVLIDEFGEFGIVLFRESSFGGHIYEQENVSLEF